MGGGGGGGYNPLSDNERERLTQLESEKQAMQAQMCVPLPQPPYKLGPASG